MTINRIIRIVLALAGFASTAWGAVQFDRLSTEGVDAGPWDWAGVAGLFVLSLAGVLVRIALRAYENARQQTRPVKRNNAPMKAIGKEAARLIAGGELDAAGVLLQAAKTLKGAP